MAVPEAEALEGPAESIPLPDESVDAAFAGQAYHWFDRERAVPELHRVIRAGGGLALLWNWWDERDPLQRELGPVVGFAGHEPFARRSCRPRRGSARSAAPSSRAPRSRARKLLVGAPLDDEHVPDDGRRTSANAASPRCTTIASRYGERFQCRGMTYVFAFERLS